MSVAILPTYRFHILRNDQIQINAIAEWATHTLYGGKIITKNSLWALTIVFCFFFLRFLFIRIESMRIIEYTVLRYTQYFMNSLVRK